jgi:hypothetical protein
LPVWHSQISGSWFRASTIITVNKVQRDALSLFLCMFY